VLRKRLIVVLTFNNGILFRTKQFLPDYRYTLNFVDAWSIDEIIMLDVTRHAESDRSKYLSVVNSFAKNCFVPLTVGGGVRTLEDVRVYLRAGADKVSVNTGAIIDPGLISEIAKQYGVQCVVVSIDVKRNSAGKYIVMSDCGAVNTGMELVTWAQQVESLGAGEILVNSVERDGSLEGLDIDLCKDASFAVNIPVVALGGVGNWSHIAEGFEKSRVAGVCTQNIYHFTDRSIKSAKAYLRKADISVR